MNKEQIYLELVKRLAAKSKMLLMAHNRGEEVDPEVRMDLADLIKEAENTK